jgi:hypothetical protein
MIIDNLYDLISGEYTEGGFWRILTLDTEDDNINIKLNGVSNNYVLNDLLQSSVNPLRVEFEDFKDAYIEFAYTVQCKGNSQEDASVVRVIIQKAVDTSGNSLYRRVSYYSDIVKVANYGEYFGFFNSVADIDIRAFTVNGQNILTGSTNIVRNFNNLPTGIFLNSDTKYANNLVDTLNAIVDASPDYTQDDIKFNYRPSLLDCDGLPAYFEICWRVNTFNIELSPGLKGYNTQQFPPSVNWNKVSYTESGIRMYNASNNSYYNYVPTDHDNPIYGESCSGYVPKGIQEYHINISQC